MKKLALCILAGLSLTACGGDGSADNDNAVGGRQQNTTDIAGIYDGALSNSKHIGGLIDRNANLWFYYSNDNDTDNGLVIGSLSVDGNKVSTLAKDFNFDAKHIDNLTIQGTVDKGKSFNGTATQVDSGDTISFNTSYDPTAQKDEAVLSKVSGNYIGSVNTLNDEGRVLFSIDSSGKLTSNDSSCKYSGTLKPVNLKNVSYYEATVTFGSSSDCMLPNQTVSGIVDFDKEDNGVYILAKNAGMTDVMVAFAEKQ